MTQTLSKSPASPESSDEQNARQCKECCRERLVALRQASERLASPNLSDDEREAIESDFDPLEIQERRQLKILLSWGGPSDGFVLTFDRDGDLLDGIYFHADWFTYAEEPLNRGDANLVLDMYLHGDASSFFTTAA